MCELPEGWVILLGNVEKLSKMLVKLQFLSLPKGWVISKSKVLFNTQLFNVKVQLTGVKVQLLRGKVAFHH